MDIALVLEALGYLDEEQSPSPDLSSYQTMVATWRHTVKVPPTEADMLVAWEAYEAELAATQYMRDRAEAYPPVGDQLDILWHSMDIGEIAKSAEFYDAMKAVKDRYPKPEDEDQV